MFALETTLFFAQLGRVAETVTTHEVPGKPPGQH